MLHLFSNGRVHKIFAVLICCAVWVGLSLLFWNGVLALSLRTVLRRLPLQIETDMLQRNVGDKPTYAEQKPINVKILATWRRKPEISLRNCWFHVIQ